jgi:hypothetical protein
MAANRASGTLLGMSFGLALVLSACGTLLPHDTENAAQDFASYREVQFAFNRVEPRVTQTPELARLGFHVDAAPNVQILSYLGVIDRFMPGGSVTINNVSPDVRRCIEARETCVGYVFNFEHREEQRVGSVALDMLSFNRTTLTSGWSAEVLFLVEDRTVIYKLLSGNPNMDERREDVRPLGPLQDLSGAARGAVIP